MSTAPYRLCGIRGVARINGARKRIEVGGAHLDATHEIATLGLALGELRTTSRNGKQEKVMQMPFATVGDATGTTIPSSYLWICDDCLAFQKSMVPREPHFG